MCTQAGRYAAHTADIATQQIYLLFGTPSSKHHIGSPSWQMIATPSWQMIATPSWQMIATPSWQMIATAMPVAGLLSCVQLVSSFSLAASFRS
jgi:hypothetical protein